MGAIRTKFPTVLFRACRRLLGRAVAVAIEWHQRAGQRQALARLDDTMLKDIGISRYDALTEARKPFWRR